MRKRRAAPSSPSGRRGRRRRGEGAFLALGLLASVSAWTPAFDLAPPPPLAVDLESAGAAELLSLPGIGPARAGAIVERRLGGGLWRGDGRAAVPAPWLCRALPYLRAGPARAE